MSNLGQTIEIPVKHVTIEHKTGQKMVFIMNALEKGWSVKKRDGSYIFSKRHEGKKEVFMDDYLESFIGSNFDTSVLCKN